jgi:hypothetical protein
MNREQWLLGIAIIIFVALGIYYLRPGGLNLFTQTNKASMAAGQDGKSGVEKTAAPGLPVASTKVDRDADIWWGRNPFLTEEETQQAGVERLRVRTIVVGSPKAVAVVDGHTVTVGEKINEEKVVEIRPDAVILERDGKKKILRLEQPTVSVGVKERKR